MQFRNNLILVSFCLFFCLCTDFVNPYLGKNDESQAVIKKKNFNDKDTIDIFCTKSMSIAVNFREYISSYRVKIEGNRLWPSSDSVIEQTQITSDPIDFSFSFSDTGWKKITITSVRNEGPQFVQTINLFAKSPLSQRQVDATPGTTIVLSTVPVCDSVTYIWDLKNGEVVESTSPTTSYILTKRFILNNGELYIRSGSDISPKTLFSVLGPLPPLNIQYNDSIIDDTIWVDSVVHIFKALLNGVGQLNTATLNGIDMKKEAGTGAQEVLVSTTLSQLDDADSVHQLNLYIKDGYGREYWDTLHLVYKPKIYKTFITVLGPSKDSMTVLDSLIRMFGIVSGDDADYSSLWAIATINNTSGSFPEKVNERLWSLSNLALISGWNDIDIKIFKDTVTANNEVAREKYHVYYLPTITFTCLNDSVVQDTVFTGNSKISFAVKITTSFSIKKVEINSDQFDTTSKVDRNSYKFTKSLRGLHSAETFDANVKVVSQDGKVYNKVFYVKYIPGLDKDNPKLTVISPPDSISTNDKSARIRGTIERYKEYGEVYLLAKVNGVPAKGYTKVKQDSLWSLGVDLMEGQNEVYIDAYEDSSGNGTSLSTVLTNIRYSPELTDTVSPQILSIQSDDGVVITDKTVILANNQINIIITAIDNVKPVKVVINDETDEFNAVTADNYRFTATIPLTHDLSTEAIQICVLDDAGNETCTNRRIIYNNKPDFTAIPQSSILVVDSTYTFNITADDADMDSLDLSVNIDIPGGGREFALDTGKTFTWKPALSDTGRRIFTYSVTDGFEKIEKEIPMMVIASESQAVPVRFSTKSDDFKSQLQANLDTMNVELVIDSLTGTRPFSITAQLKGDELPVTKVSDRVSRLLWKPGEADIGFQIITVIVRDSMNYSDTLEVQILVNHAPRTLIFWKPTSASYNENSTGNTINAFLSEPCLVKDTIPCVIDWQNSTATSSDISIDDTVYLIFDVGDTIASIKLDIINDTEVEKDKTFSMRMVSIPDYMQFKSGGIFTGTIIDDDKISYSFMQSSASGSENDTNANKSVSILLSRAVSTETIINYSIDSQSSASDTEYVLLQNEITIPANSDSGKLFFTIKNDAVTEDDETIIFNITSTSSTMIPGDITTFTYTIENDDIEKCIVNFSGNVVENLELYENKPEGTSFNIVLSKELGVSLTVFYGESRWNNDNPQVDFTLTPADSVVFEPGITKKTILIKPINDTQKERPEYGLEVGHIIISGVSNENVADVGLNYYKSFTIYDDD